ncbi:hypothetical protein CLHUN_41520 [Ruminiclostridium hungatei]|uniref:Uncharacterized protein n=1 Tax=Ruminiclostridium hungatei TaxID=48256 RepID=A0A1V4SFG4_RUMHU|nr:hypothetical protein [Ruminiclostridium hungatei]OPX41981.1 hypothetical protein CLHUN_41520 [Ruminiclostridium hungatei]
MDDRFKKLLTIIGMIFLFIIALRILGFVLNLLFPVAIIGLIGYIVFRVINKNGAKKY